MYRLLCFTILLFSLNAYTFENNDFYDNAPTFLLNVKELMVSGEIRNPGKVDFSNLPLHSLITRETELTNKGEKFIGAYRYEGYSLFDILKERYLKKKNAHQFKPIIDLLIEIKNDKGERVVLSWGEIYYPVNRHKIIIAKQVAAVNPSFSSDRWPIPKKSKLIVGNDLHSNRFIEEPTEIKIFSAPYIFKVDRNIRLYSPQITIYRTINNIHKPLGTIQKLNSTIEKRSHQTVFYGRGRGFHGTTTFTGNLLAKELGKFVKLTPQNIKTGYVVISAIDGYRISISFSELLDRNDFAEFIIIDKGINKKGGRFAIFPSGDYFSDRAVKAVNEIYLNY